MSRSENDAWMAYDQNTTESLSPTAIKNACFASGQNVSIINTIEPKCAVSDSHDDS